MSLAHDINAALRSPKLEDLCGESLTLATSKRAKGGRCTVIVADHHVPDHDRATLIMSAQAVIDLDADLWILGDFCDSDFANPHGRRKVEPPTYQQHMEASRQVRAVYDKACALADEKHRRKDRVKEVYHGNHDEWFHRWILSVPDELRDYVKPPDEEIGWADHGWSIVVLDEDTIEHSGTSRVGVQPVLRDGVWVHHGQSCSVHHAWQQITKQQVSQVYAHTHRAQQIYYSRPHETEAGMLRVVHATGIPCARNLRACWTPQPRWTGWVNGFAIAEHYEGEMHIYNVVIRDGRAAYGRHRWSVT